MNATRRWSAARSKSTIPGSAAGSIVNAPFASKSPLTVVAAPAPAGATAATSATATKVTASDEGRRTQRASENTTILSVSTSFEHETLD
jgi:hypothetical protein